MRITQLIDSKVEWLLFFCVYGALLTNVDIHLFFQPLPGTYCVPSAELDIGKR